MVGDGVNDSKALKAADIGLSFVQQKTSLNTSFQTEVCNISSVKNLLIEGRNSYRISLILLFFTQSFLIVKVIGMLMLRLFGCAIKLDQNFLIDVTSVIPILLAFSLTRPRKVELTSERIRPFMLFVSFTLAVLIQLITFYALLLYVTYEEPIHNFCKNHCYMFEENFDRCLKNYNSNCPARPGYYI